MQNSIVFGLFLLFVQVCLTTQETWEHVTKCTTKPQQYQSQSHIDNKRRRRRREQHDNILELKCPLESQFIYIGQTQYGVWPQQQQSQTKSDQCASNNSIDCLVSVDYLSNECNGMNSCIIQLDSQYLHTCRNYSDYLNIKYKCIDEKYKINICSSSTSTLSADTIENIYLTTPNYPLEYDNNLSNCSCSIEPEPLEDGHRVNGDLLSVSIENYEFDVEEGDNLRQCNKDRLSITTMPNSDEPLQLCGNEKQQFKEYIVKNKKKIQFKFQTDDTITRRGFLLKIKPTQNDLECPFNSDYLTSSKCVKYIDRSLTYADAQNYCTYLNGNLLHVASFIENIKLTNYLQDLQQFTQSQTKQFWSKMFNQRQKSLKSCSYFNVNSWSMDNCQKQMPFMCEFNVAKQTKKPVNGLRVKCGRDESSPSPSPTTTKAVRPHKPIIIEPFEQQPQQKPQQTTTKGSLFFAPINNSSNLAIIIGVVCGVSIVVLFVNIFCIWNYYNRKIKSIPNETKPCADKFSSLLSSSTSTSSTASTTATNLTGNHDLLYLNDQAQFQKPTSEQQQTGQHLYETVQSLYYSQIQNPYLVDLSSSTTTTTTDLNAYSVFGNGSIYRQLQTTTGQTCGNAIILLNNGQNYYMSCVSPSLLSSASSTQPLIAQNDANNV